MKLRRIEWKGPWRAAIALAIFGTLAGTSQAQAAAREDPVAQDRAPTPTLAFLPDIGSGYSGVTFKGGPAFGLCRIVVSDKPDALFDLRLLLDTGKGLPSGPTGFRAAVTCDLDGSGGVLWSLPNHVLMPGLYVLAYVLPVEGAERRFTDLIVTHSSSQASAAGGSGAGAGGTAGSSFLAQSNGVAPNGSAAGSSGSQTGYMVVTEFMKDPAAVSDTNGEWVEIYNGSAHRQNVEGWVLSDDGSNAHLIYNQGQGVWVLPRRTLVLSRNADPSANGLFFNPSYAYSGFSLSNGADEIVLTSRVGELSDRVAYDSSWPSVPGSSVALAPGLEDPLSNDVPSNWCVGSSPIWLGGTDLGTPGWQNEFCP